jgi:hypothetical protein
MVNLQDWEQNKGDWSDSDFALITSNEGWKVRNQKNGINIYQRSFADDKNDLFRCRLPNIEALHTEVFEVFTNKMLEYHQY